MLTLTVPTVLSQDAVTMVINAVMLGLNLIIFPQRKNNLGLVKLSLKKSRQEMRGSATTACEGVVDGSPSLSLLLLKGASSPHCHQVLLVGDGWCRVFTAVQTVRLLLCQISLFTIIKIAEETKNIFVKGRF